MRGKAKIRYTAFETDLGWVALAASPQGLLQVTLPQASREEALSLLGQNVEKANLDPSPFGDLPRRLKRYLAGEWVTLPHRLDLAHASPFRRSVWEATRSIPPGETRSYRWVAQCIGKPGAARAVGQALAANPLPLVVPCHRVVGSKGALGGFGGGLEMKRSLLNLEAKLRRRS